MTRARLELIWNAISKGSGVVSLISGTVVIIAGLACLIPPFYMFSVFGRQLPLTDDLPGPGTASMIWLATLHVLLVVGMGGAAGLRQHRGFDRELLRSLPLRTSQLLLAELPFGLLDTIPMLGLACFSGLAVGLVQSHPNSAPAVVLVTGLGVLSVLLMQQFVGVAKRLAGRPKFFAIGSAVALVPAAWISWAVATKGVKPGFTFVLEWLPTSIGYHGLWAWELGDTGGAAGYLAATAGIVGGLFALTAWLQLIDLGQDPVLRVARGGKEKLWSFRTSRGGVGRLFVAQVVGARYGKVLLLLPFFVTGGFVLCAAKVQYVAEGSVMQQLFDEARTYPLYALVPPLVVFLGGGLWMNQFAWHGRGIKTLLLAPLESADILSGNLLGLAGILLPLSLVACLPLAYLGAPLPHELGAGFAGAMFVVCVLATAGHLFSMRFPRALAESGVGVGTPPFTLQLMSTGVMLAVGVAGIGVYAGLRGVHDWAPAGAFVLLALITVAARRSAVPRMALALDGGREKLAETLS